MQPDNPPILEADMLYHIYESQAIDGNVVALRGLNVTIFEGEAVAVVGPSGSGKSTLLKCLGGLMKPSSGFVSLGGKPMVRLTGSELVELRQKTVSFIFQDSNLLAHMNALDNVAQPLRHQGVLPGPARQRSQALLDKLGMGFATLRVVSRDMAADAVKAVLNDWFKARAAETFAERLGRFAQTLPWLD